MNQFQNSVKYICITVFLIFLTNNGFDLYLKNIEFKLKNPPKEEPVKRLDDMFPIIPKEFILPQAPLIIPQSEPKNYANK